MESREPYRVPAPPGPRVFALALGETARRALSGSGAVFAVSLVLAATTGRGLVVLVASLGPAAAFLFSGAPRAFELHADHVVLRRWFGGAVRLPLEGLQVQHLPYELVLVHGRETLSLGAELFPGESFADCARALRAVVEHFEARVPRTLPPR